jgi:hypothetical protein
MTTLKVHHGSRTGPAPADPWQFNPIRELHRAGTRVIRRCDLEWFLWQPRANTIVVNADLDQIAMRGTVSLALAHRALGHWGNSLRQDIEARTLSARWLISDTDAAWARTAVPVLGIDATAARLRLRPAALRIRLGAVCRCLSNLEVYRRDVCECDEAAAA